MRFRPAKGRPKETVLESYSEARDRKGHRKRGRISSLYEPDEFVDKAVYHYLIARDLGEDYTREEVEEKIARGLAQPNAVRPSMERKHFANFGPTVLNAAGSTVEAV